MATFPYRFGRRPRAHDPRIPRYRKLTAAQPAFSIPDAVDYTAGLPAALGMYGNDSLGDCVVEGTVVAASGIERAYRSLYQGPIVRIALRSGKRLAVTPNHAVLTPRGFIRAKHLQQGDDLVGARGPEVLPRILAARGQNHLYQPPAPVQQIFASLNLGTRSRRVIVPRAVDFHGDAQRFNSKVDVVSAFGFLRGESHTSLGQPYAEEQIRAACKLKRRLHGARTSLKRLLAGLPTALCDIGLSAQGPALAHAHAGVSQSNCLKQRSWLVAGSADGFLKPPSRHTEFARNGLHGLARDIAPHRFGEVGHSISDGDRVLRTGRSKFDASFLHPSEHGAVTDTGIFGELVDAFPGLVETDQITQIDVDSFEGHVFDLSTASRWYVADGIITHNCTCAALYHALQVWTFNAANAIDTEPDAEAVALYEQSCGYDPSNPSTDQGGVEQEVLAYAVQPGIPVTSGRHTLAAFVEVDVRNHDDIKRSIADCGVCYIGFNVPAFLEQSGMGAGSTWDVTPGGDQSIVGGHAVILAGYDAAGAIVISWGALYRMTWAFFAAFTDEAYALADANWINATGKTPAGMSLADLEALMDAIKEQES